MFTNLAPLQLLAILTMLVDHLGALSFLGDWSRLLGRVALPAFVIMIALNALHTPRPGRMALRCLLLLLVSQPLWSLSVGSPYQLCILVTLLAVVLLVWSWRLRWPLLALLVLGAFLIVSPWVEYRLWPLLLVPVILWFNPLTLVLALSWPAFQYEPYTPFAYAALVGVLVSLFLLRVPFNVPRLPRPVTRWFYPGHLLILFLSKPLT